MGGFIFYQIAVTTISASVCSFLTYNIYAGIIALTKNKTADCLPRPKSILPSRSEQLQNLRSCQEFDVLIIGGGATGAGCALDAASRGLKTAMIELDDFAAAASSRSTKLIHGGVRYLQSAITKLDYEQFKMVKEALQERAFMLSCAPHLTQQLAIMIPIYHYWQIPFFWIGLKCYDLISMGKKLKSSYYIRSENAVEVFPLLKKDNLYGAIVYFDGQMNDSRMCLAILLTAARFGATVCNHVAVKALLKIDNGYGKQVLCGAVVKDNETDKEFTVRAKCVINATGPFIDSIRKMDDSNITPMCTPSSGTHISLPGYFCPREVGLLEPATSDGRVIFFLPWQEHTLVGTTDQPCEITHSPKPSEAEICYILNEVKKYLNTDISLRRCDILSAWSGIRPLIIDPNKSDTKSLIRNHIVHVSESNLISIAGGKWTTYRAMAEQTIDTAIKVCKLQPASKKSITSEIIVDGAENWKPTLYIRLIQEYGLEYEVAKHLAKAYGSRADEVCKLATYTNKSWPIIGKKIHEKFPYIEADIRYGVREYACTAVDMIARRLRIALLNSKAALEIIPKIVKIMGEELSWSNDEKQKQMKLAEQFIIEEMGLSLIGK